MNYQIHLAARLQKNIPVGDIPPDESDALIHLILQRLQIKDP
jgi:hypothetical protein